LIVVQLVLFGVTAHTIGVSLVAQTGLDGLSYTQVCSIATLLINAVGWMFFGPCVHKFNSLRPRF
jgi:hypothetical protein